MFYIKIRTLLQAECFRNLLLKECAVNMSTNTSFLVCPDGSDWAVTEPDIWGPLFTLLPHYAAFLSILIYPVHHKPSHLSAFLTVTEVSVA